MRIAALYDVHGMLAPLEAVLAEVEREDVDTIVLGGDCIQGPQPVETLERLRALGDRALWLRGNTDRLIAEHAGDDSVHGAMRWVNAGSVGMPRGELVSGWTLLGRRGVGSTKPRRSGGAGLAGAGAGVVVELRTPYDVDAAVAALRAVGGEVAEYWIDDIERRARA